MGPASMIPVLLPKEEHLLRPDEEDLLLEKTYQAAHLVLGDAKEKGNLLLGTCV